MFPKEAMELQATMSTVVETLEKFKRNYKGDDFPLQEYNSFLESIDRKFKQSSSLSDDIMPKFGDTPDRIQTEKNDIFENLNTFLKNKLNVGKNAEVLENIGIFLHSPKKDEEDEFDISILTKLFEDNVKLDKLEESREDLVTLHSDSLDEKILNESSNKEFVVKINDANKLRKFIPTVNAAAERIEDKISAVGDMYDDILTDLLKTSEEIMRTETKINELRIQLKDVNSEKKNEL